MLWKLLTFSVKLIDLYSSHVIGESGFALFFRIASCSAWSFNPNVKKSKIIVNIVLLHPRGMTGVASRLADGGGRTKPLAPSGVAHGPPHETRVVCEPPFFFFFFSIYIYFFYEKWYVSSFYWCWSGILTEFDKCFDEIWQPGLNCYFGLPRRPHNYLLYRRKRFVN